MATCSKKVHFKEKVRVRRVPSRASISDDLKAELWVSNEEILKRAHGCKKNFTFRKMAQLLSPDTIDDPSGLYLDGLESSRDKRKRHDRMFRAMHSVLEEQNRLWNAKGISSTSGSAPPDLMEEQIATVYSKHAAESADLAHERGVNHAKASTTSDNQKSSLQNMSVSKDETGTTTASNAAKVDSSRGRQSIFDSLKGASGRSPGPLRRSPQPNRELERRHQ